jgi:DNA-directed RNA polymerase specialized sigma54-like protein
MSTSVPDVYWGPGSQGLVMGERPSVNTSGEWRRALDVSERLMRTTSELELEPRTEWLRQVMNEAASQLRAAVLWAASQGLTEDGVQRVRSHVVAADAARSDASLASYFLNFLNREGLIEEAKALEVESLLQQTEIDMAEMSQRLTRELGFDPYFR